MKKLFLFFAFALMMSVKGYSHVPFLKPNQFRVFHHRFHIESSFTEQPFQADFAMNVPVFTMIMPDGTNEGIYPTALTKAAAYLTPEITQEGTYRFSTGMRVGPLYNAIEGEKERLYFADEMKTAKGKRVTMQYYSNADVYVSNGKPNYKPTILGKGVEIIPMTSPNELFLSKDLKVQVLLDGKPAPKSRIVVVYDNEHYQFHRQGDLYDVDNIRKNNIYTDENGIATFTPDKAGLVMLFVTIHKRINPTRWESYNASLTLETQLP